MLLPVTHELKRPPAAPTPPSPRGAAGWKEGLTRSQNTAAVSRRWRLWVTLDDSLRLSAASRRDLGEPSDLPLPPAVSLSFPTWREGVQQHLCLLPWGGTEAGGGPCKPFGDRAFGPVCRNEEHGGAHSKPPTVSRTQHDKEGSISLKDFRGTPGALRRHSAQCPAPGKSSMGGLVRIVYLGKNNCHRLSSGLSSSEVLADTPPPAGTPDEKLVPRAKGRGRLACAGAPPESATGITLSLWSPVAPAFSQPLMTSAKRQGNPCLAPAGSAGGWKAASGR